MFRVAFFIHAKLFRPFQNHPAIPFERYDCTLKDSASSNPRDGRSLANHFEIGESYIYIYYIDIYIYR